MQGSGKGGQGVDLSPLVHSGHGKFNPVVLLNVRSMRHAKPAKEDLLGYTVMEKRTGWGSEYTDDIRGGEWE